MSNGVQQGHRLAQGAEEFEKCLGGTLQGIAE
jgi:hypothetical protein